MKFRSFLIAGLMALGACDAADSEGDPAGPGGGKADEIVDGEQCPDVVELAHFVSQDHVQTRCRNPETGAFVPDACAACDSAYDDFTLATNCPPQAKWNDAEGSARRCVEDDGDSEGGAFVPSQCCAELCEPAGWDDPETQTGCRGFETGQFVASACCILNDNQRCEGATFDVDEAADGIHHCRVAGGDFAGQFAPQACCLDECFTAVESLLNRFLQDPTQFDLFTSLEGVPQGCIAAEDELDDACATAGTDGGGMCRRSDGTFAPSMCCFEDTLDAAFSDKCFEAQVVGQTLPECAQGE